MSMKKQRWMVLNKSGDFKGLGEKLGLDPVTVRILVNRGLTTEEEMKAFVEADVQSLYDPHLMKDMDKGTTLIAEAIKDGKKIRIIGDYDADGITSSYILHRTISSLDGDVSVAIPHRVKDGYGLNLNLINQCREDGIEVIITCDNGVAAPEALMLAKEYHMTTVVTDHHRIPGNENEDGSFTEDKIPADAVINPKQQACRYPFKDLCGAGIAYKFSLALIERMTDRAWNVMDKQKEELMMYAAIGTIGDVMDLLGENRVIVKCGLNYIKTCEDPSLLALLDQCGLDKNNIRSGNVGFQIAPCLNASGRIDSPRHAMDLLLCKDAEYCRNQAERLVEMNEQRKQMTEQFVEQAVEMAHESEDKVLVLYLPQCHESIAGIVAGRIRERFMKPTLVITKGEEMCKGSGRSIEAYDMYRELSKVKTIFSKFGGHSMAVGFSLEEDRIQMLREKLNLNSTLREEDFDEKVLIDVPMPMEYVSMKLVEEFGCLEPFGKGNTTPLFAQKDLTLLYVKVIGRDKKFIRLQLLTSTGLRVEGVYFVSPDEFFEYLTQTYGAEISEHYARGNRGDLKVAVCYQPEIHTYMEKRSIRYNIKYFL